MTKSATIVSKKPTAIELADDLRRVETLCNSLFRDLKQFRGDQQRFLESLVTQLVAQRNVDTSTETQSKTYFDVTELTRALLLSRDRCDAAIGLATRRYLDVLKDIQELRKRSDDGDIVEIAIKTLNRYLVYHRQDLETLGVKLTEIASGIAIDSNYHEVVARHPTKRDQLAGTVAIAWSPLMTWKDTNGTPQLIPAKVVAYVLDGGLGSAPTVLVRPVRA